MTDNIVGKSEGGSNMKNKVFATLFGVLALFCFTRIGDTADIITKENKTHSTLDCGISHMWFFEKADYFLRHSL